MRAIAQSRIIHGRVYPQPNTLEGCLGELREALSDWLALRLRLGLIIPVIANINLNELTQPVEKCL